MKEDQLSLWNGIQTKVSESRNMNKKFFIGLVVGFILTGILRSACADTLHVSFDEPVLTYGASPFIMTVDTSRFSTTGCEFVEGVRDFALKYGPEMRRCRANGVKITTWKSFGQTLYVTPAPWTLMLWIYVHEDAVENYILGTVENLSGNRSDYIKIKGGIIDVTGHKFTTVVPEQIWTHVGLTFEQSFGRTVMVLYLNGTRMEEIEATPNIAHQCIPERGSADLDELTLMSTAVSEQVIKDNYGTTVQTVVPRVVTSTVPHREYSVVNVLGRRVSRSHLMKRNVAIRMGP